MNHYQEIAHYYDLLMNGGYYDHESMARIIQSTIGQRKRLLELGIGTGLLTRELLKIDSSYSITGIDFSIAMLKIAKERLPSHVPLIECDVAKMNLGCKFEVAFSSGGTWVIIQSSEGLMLGTHLFDHKKDFQGLQNVAAHLEPEGLLLLSIHPPHEERDIELANGIVYSQKIQGDSKMSDHFALDKSYYFKKDGNILAEETLTLGFYKEILFLPMLAEAGFEPLGMTDSEKFFIFKKIHA